MPEPQLSVRSARARDLVTAWRGVKAARSPTLSNAPWNLTRRGRRDASQRRSFTRVWRRGASILICRSPASRTGASTFDLQFVDTNVISGDDEKAPDITVIRWLERFDAELALPTIAIAEIAYGIEKIMPEQRALRLYETLLGWRRRFAGRIFGFTEKGSYGLRGNHGRGVPAPAFACQLPNGMIAAIAHVNGGVLATRNLDDFRLAGIGLVNPWSL